MIERHIIIDNVDPVTFYGVNNSNIQLIRNLFPKLRMAARGSVITVIGDETETAEFEKKVHSLADYCATLDAKAFRADLSPDALAQNVNALAQAADYSTTVNVLIERLWNFLAA